MKISSNWLREYLIDNIDNIVKNEKLTMKMLRFSIYRTLEDQKNIYNKIYSSLINIVGEKLLEDAIERLINETCDKIAENIIGAFEEVIEYCNENRKTFSLKDCLEYFKEAHNNKVLTMMSGIEVIKQED